MTFAVLFVCTGNICRSPIGERLFAARTRGHAGAGGTVITAASAGTNGLDGYAMDLPSASVLRELGVDPDGHRARRVSATDLETSDLVLTATREHRAALLKLVPLAFRRTFTLREFGRLGAQLPAPDVLPDVAALRERVRAVAAQRGFVAPPEPGSLDDIGDPFGASMDVTRRAGREVSDAVNAIIAALGLPAAG